MGKWENGKMGKWDNRKMGKWERQIGDMIYGLFKTLANTVCIFSQFETR